MAEQIELYSQQQNLPTLKEMGIPFVRENTKQRFEDIYAFSEKTPSHPVFKGEASEKIHLPKNSYEIQGNTLLLRTFDNLSETELETSLNALIRDYRITSIRLAPDISHDAHRQVANIIMRNHPLFEMMRLIHGNDVVNVTFGGIKDLNDLLGQKFVDDFIGGVVRREIITRFDNYSKDRAIA